MNVSIHLVLKKSIYNGSNDTKYSSYFCKHWNKYLYVFSSLWTVITMLLMLWNVLSFYLALS